jgi:hypothetical protein
MGHPCRRSSGCLRSPPRGAMSVLTELERRTVVGSASVDTAATEQRAAADPATNASAGRNRRGSGWRPKVRWFAAEFLVVVCGVIVALAASDWTQRERERQLAEDYAVRVVEDLDRIAGWLQVVIGWTRALEASGEILLPVVERGGGVSDSLLLVTAAYQASRLTQPDLSPIAYREMLATGQIRLFRNSDVRQSLAHYFADLERAAGFLESFPAGYSATVRGILPLRIQLAVRDRCPNYEADIRACTPAADGEEAGVGVERLLAAPDAVAQLRHALHQQKAIRDYMESQYEANRALRQLLEGRAG